MWMVLGLAAVVIIGAIIWVNRSGVSPAFAGVRGPVPCNDDDDVIAIKGDGAYDFNIVGESHYQDILSQICGGHAEGGHGFDCAAELVPDPNNKYDSNCVRVLIGGQLVGHLSRDDNEDYLEALAGSGLRGRTAMCRARVVGGWRDAKGDGNFGVKLDITDDFEFVA